MKKERFTEEEIKQREKKLEWFFRLNSDEKSDLKDRYYPLQPIRIDPIFGIAFTIGQIMDMYDKEHAFNANK